MSKMPTGEHTYAWSASRIWCTRPSPRCRWSPGHSCAVSPGTRRLEMSSNSTDFQRAPLPRRKWKHLLPAVLVPGRRHTEEGDTCWRKNDAACGVMYAVNPWDRPVRSSPQHITVEHDRCAGECGRGKCVALPGERNGQSSLIPGVCVHSNNLDCTVTVQFCLDFFRLNFQATENRQFSYGGGGGIEPAHKGFADLEQPPYKA